jgi:4-hydroxy-3-methylbut-2-enyl diphosphate reductase
MHIVLSDYAGACYGVERALSLVEKALCTKDKAVHTLGPLIHNPGVVATLEARGVHMVTQAQEVDKGVLVIRSHGVAPAVIEDAQKRKLDVVDATCPHVLKAQKAARSLSADGYTVVVVGESGHPEVEGISAYADEGAIVVQSPDDLPDALFEPSVDGATPRVGLVVQTTQSPEALHAVVEALEARGISPEVKNTICSATRQRQEAARRLANEADVMFVVGGYNSGNTTRLYEICKSVCAHTVHIESPADIDFAWLERLGSSVDAADPADADTCIGITAGASTPQEQIASVVEALYNGLAAVLSRESSKAVPAQGTN